jgi:hypothetical protein
MEKDQGRAQRENIFREWEDNIILLWDIDMLLFTS